MAQPTEKQLNYIRRLGYTGTPPETIKDASALIKRLLEGLQDSYVYRPIYGLESPDPFSS